MNTKPLITGLAFEALTTLVSAQDQGTDHKQQNATGRGIAWLDANKNGICDYREKPAKK